MRLAYTYIEVISEVNVSKYGIHGLSGHGSLGCCSTAQRGVQVQLCCALSRIGRHGPALQEAIRAKDCSGRDRGCFQHAGEVEQHSPSMPIPYVLITGWEGS